MFARFLLAENSSKHSAMDKSKDQKKVAAAVARSKSLSPEKRKEIAKKAAASRWDKEKDVPQSAYTGELVIGEMKFPCSVLSNGTRILAQSDFMEGI